MTLRVPKDFEDLDFINRRMRRLIKALSRKKGKKYKDLREKLEKCLSDESGQCNSGACFKCSRKMRLQLLFEISPFLKNAIGTNFVTLAIDKFSIPKKDLKHQNLKDIASKYARKLRVVLPKNMIVIGGVDVSLNSFDNDQYHWQIHIHVLMIKVTKGATFKDARKSMARIIKNSEISRPLRFDKTKKKTLNSAVTYCLKSWFGWRSGYNRADILNSGSSQKKTRSIPLPPKDEIQLRIWLDRWTMPERLILVGATNKNSPKSIKLSDTSRTPKKGGK